MKNMASVKIAVLSDIHSNYVALETCLAYLQEKGMDAYIFLGDYLAELPYPERTMEILYEIKRKKDCQFLILHGENGQWREEFVSLTYDWKRVVKELKTSELYEYSTMWGRITANLLEKGEPPHAEVLKEAMKLCEEETGEAIWYDIPNIYWERAIQSMIEGK